MIRSANRNASSQAGFTIVELLIVIVIIGILSALAIVAYSGISQRAKVAMVVSDLRSSATQLQLGRVDFGGYPDSLDCTASPAPKTSCLKASRGTTYQYTVDNTPNQQTFCLTASNGGIDYMVTHDTAPVVGVCPGQVASGIPATVADNFNRTAGNLGATSTGSLNWSALSGTWTTDGTAAKTSTADASNPLATVNFGTADVDASIDVSSSGGGDSLIVRASDASNYIRARYYHHYVTTSSTTYGYCSVGGWTYGGQVYTEGTSPGESIPGGKVGGYYCNQVDEYPGWNGTGKATQKTDVTSVHVTCNPPYVNNCYWGNTYTRPVSEISDNTTSSTTYYFNVYLEKVVAGVSTTLYNGTLGSGVSKLRLTTTGSTIKLYLNGSATASATLTEPFNQTAVNHGIGRGPTGNYTTSAIDNFSLIRN